MTNNRSDTRAVKQKEIFELFVRLIGLGLIFLSIKSIPTVFNYFGALVEVVLYFAAGWWFVGGAPLLTKRAYPTSAPESQESGEVGIKTSDKS